MCAGGKNIIQEELNVLNAIKEQMSTNCDF